MGNLRKLEKITTDIIASHGVQKLADRPNATKQYGQGGLSAQQLKLWFDKLATYLAGKINELQDTMSRDDAAEFIRLTLDAYGISSLDDLVRSFISGDFAAEVLRVYPSISAKEMLSLQQVINQITAKIYSEDFTSDELKLHNSSENAHKDIRELIAAEHLVYYNPDSEVLVIGAHKHAYSYVSDDDTTHTGTCDCKDFITEAHIWNNGDITEHPSYTVEGIKTYTCNICGATKTESVPVLSIPESGYLLSDFGQLHYVAYSEDAEAPTVDGRIDEGEYVVAETDMIPQYKTSAYSMLGDDRFFRTNLNDCDVTNVSIYASRVGRYLYLALKSVDTDVKYKEAVFFDIGYSDNTEECLRFTVTYTGETPSVKMQKIVCTGHNPSDAVYTTLAESDVVLYLVKCAAVYDEAKQEMVFEIKLDLDAISEYAGQTLTKLLFRAVLNFYDSVITSSSGSGSLWFAFQSNMDITAKHYSLLGRYPHVLILE